jgi:hypothetical protein
LAIVVRGTIDVAGAGTMAKKKGSAIVEAVAEPTEKARGELKPVRLDLSSDVHRNLRLVSAHAGMSMASYARDALARVLAEEMKARKLEG